MQLRRFLWPKSLAGKLCAVGFAFLLILVVAYAAAAHFTSKRLAAAMKLSEEFGLSHDLDELLGPSVAPEKNAAIALNEAGTLAKQFFNQSRQKHKLDANADVLEHPALLAEYETLLNDAEYNRLLAQGDQREAYRSTEIFVRPMIMANANSALSDLRRSLARAEHDVVLHLLRADRREEAARRTLRVLRTIRKWEDKEPFLNASLVNIAVRGVAFSDLNAILRGGGPLSPTLHAEIDEELGRQESIMRVIPWMIQTGSLLGLDFYEQAPFSRIPFGSVIANEGRTNALRYAYRVQRTADMPYIDAFNEIQTMISEWKQAEGNPFGAMMTFGAASSLGAEPMGRKAFERTVARARCLRALNAMASRGDFNAGLSSLGVPKASLVDPFDMKTLRVKKTPNGPIIYSVGDDLTDDDGKVLPPEISDHGFAPVQTNAEKK